MQQDLLGKQDDQPTSDVGGLLDAIVRQKIEKWSNSCYDGIWCGYSPLSDETGIPVNKLKKICKKLKTDGVIKLKPTYDDDGMICGSGYFIA